MIKYRSPFLLRSCGILLLLLTVLAAPSPADAQGAGTKDTTGNVRQRHMPVLEVHPEPLHLPRDYRASAPRVNDLVQTKLDVRFDFPKHYLYGKEWVTLQPHFYPTDSLTLDAKGMDIHEVAVMSGDRKKPLHYAYDGSELHIR